MFFRFLLVGGTAFLLDAGITLGLIQLQIDPWFARIPAMLIAMTYAWLANRHFTYRVSSRRSAKEAFLYFLVAVNVSLINYMIYVFLLTVGIWPFFAVAVATACQTVISFFAYRLIVFKEIE